MKQLILLRHGESEWNKLNLFTGWTDVELSEKGWDEAKAAGELMKSEGFTFDKCYTSYLKRAIHTAQTALSAMELDWIPMEKTWKLNERHYGALQGLNKAETAEKYGEEQVTLWRRSYDVCPPALEENDDRAPGKDTRYAGTPAEGHPLTESLEITVQRVVPFYEDVIVPDIKAGKRILVAAHGNSLRALVKYLDGMTPEEIIKVNIPTGAPLLYEFDDDMKVVGKRYLGDQEAIAAKAKAVSEQAKKKA
ncbi:MAG: 2,3-diphosphoglycerate-dependent phosphoglycerate mutase [archaeon]|nr:2,3-diphosphoglycerate-dependent phosphoglycerate mutase [archaeon]